LRQEIRRWIEDNLPKPDCRVFVDLSAVIITENQELPHMATQDFDVTLSGDAPFGYTASGVSATNKSGVPVTDPATMATSDAAVCDAVWLGDGKVWLKPVDAAAAGATCVVSGSFVDGDTDDFRFNVTIGADRITTDVGGVAIVENDAAPV
jgi:hypothetical protein